MGVVDLGVVVLGVVDLGVVVLGVVGLLVFGSVGPSVCVTVCVSDQVTMKRGTHIRLPLRGTQWDNIFQFPGPCDL